MEGKKHEHLDESIRKLTLRDINEYTNKSFGAPGLVAGNFSGAGWSSNDRKRCFFGSEA